MARINQHQGKKIQFDTIWAAHLSPTVIGLRANKKLGTFLGKWCCLRWGPQHAVWYQKYILDLLFNWFGKRIVSKKSPNEKQWWLKAPKWGRWVTEADQHLDLGDKNSKDTSQHLQAPFNVGPPRNAKKADHTTQENSGRYIRSRGELPVPKEHPLLKPSIKRTVPGNNGDKGM